MNVSKTASQFGNGCRKYQSKAPEKQEKIKKNFLTTQKKEIIMISHTKKCDEGIMRRLDVTESRWLL